MCPGESPRGMAREGAGLPGIGGSVFIRISRDIRSSSGVLLKIVMISLLPDSEPASQYHEKVLPAMAIPLVSESFVEISKRIHESNRGVMKLRAQIYVITDCGSSDLFTI